MSTEQLEKLGQVKKDNYNGDFVFGLQGNTGTGTATDKGFGHVHKDWYAKTKSYEQGFDALAKGKAETEDFKAPIDAFKPTLDPNGAFAFEYEGRYFKPTDYCIQKAGTLLGTGTWYASQLAAGDAADGDTLARCFENGIRHLKSAITDSKRRENMFLFRTRKDGTLRAILSNKYAIIDNRWFMDIVRSIIPGGRLSHWRGDSDSIYGNVLVPDTIMNDDDSDYGGMVSLSNCEIGTRVESETPSVFRAICMNGCIWDREFGKSQRQVHRGEIDLAELGGEIRHNIEAQLPLLPAGIQRLLGLRKLYSDVALQPLFAQVAIDYKIAKPELQHVVKAYGEEQVVAPQYGRTLFALTNAITRAGQQLPNNRWVAFDEIAGELTSFQQNDWDSLTSRASKLKAKKVDEFFALAS